MEALALTLEACAPVERGRAMAADDELALIPDVSDAQSSAALERACAAFNEDPVVRDTLAAALLGEATGRLRVLRLAA